jgi:2-hydroxychromene-2-carboxylate isomerase/predicted O-methyltransferase YrrM
MDPSPASTGGDHAVEFWFEFASTYSYPAAMRIRAAAHQARVTVRWKAFLLGPIFKELGWNDSPFNLQPAKGRYMWRDLERICAGLGLAWRRPTQFPRSGLVAARVAAAFPDEEWLPAFVERVYRANFAEDCDIADAATVRACLRDVGVDADAALHQALGDAGKAALRRQTEEAVGKGIFGAPSFVAGDELFWGNDRLETALAWARGWPARRGLGAPSARPSALPAIERDTAAVGFDMASDRATGALLRMLAAAKPGGRFLEIGTGTGLATAWLADGMDGGATLATIDSDESVAGVARRHLGEDARIEFRIGDAATILDQLSGAYDLIFADAWPGKFAQLDRALDLLAPGGLYVIDDLLPQPNWPDGHGENVRRLLAELDARADLRSVRLDWSSGILIAAKTG